MQLPGPLAHVPAWGATASGPPPAGQSCCPLSSPKIVLPREGAPSLQVALPGWLCHTRGPGTGAVLWLLRPHAVQSRAGATHGISSFSAWMQKMEEVSSLENRE